MQGRAANHCVKFQFQYGAIKSPLDCLIISQVCPFQFQYGAIKSLL